ncbi:37s ribosomal protein [Colletotrichum karsti]|uniref:Small ribosomal subunit protein bS18m n=1 Tax=Colletotrichum karsti TaxID=1095194 RepID=A0A9P6IED6_9PEZI|nr:37s ribosomal protein [Colletotrichum karsti]KAF9881978.1 37s ribosomal protein [Colletotrichum karsti]
MPPRLTSLPAFKAPSAFFCRTARPFSSTPAASQVENHGRGILELDKPATPSPSDRIRGLISRRSTPSGEDSSVTRKRNMLDTLKGKKISDDYLKQMSRRWKTGDVYAPHDLSPTEMDKWRKIQKPKADVIDMLGINPLDHYRNFSIISEFMTPFGHIKHAKETGLRAVNHRKISKAIRRAIGMGIHPSVHHHPELLRARRNNNAGWR